MVKVSRPSCCSCSDGCSCSSSISIHCKKKKGHEDLDSWFCSNPRYSSVTYFILSNFCNFSQLVLSTHPFLLYQFCYLINLSSSYQSFVIFSPFLIYSLFYGIYSPYKCTCTTHQTHNSLPSFIVLTLSAPIYLSISPDVFGHRAILMWGIEAWLGVSS